MIVSAAQASERLGGVRWRASSYSGGGNGNNCVEVGAPTHGALVAVRDSKNRGGPAFVVSAGAWRGLLASVRDGRLPHA